MFIHVTSSDERLKHKCVYLSNEQIFEPNLVQSTTIYRTFNTPEWPNSHNLKIEDGGGRHLEFRKNVDNSGLDKDICIKFYGIMHHARGHAEMTT